MVIVLGVLMLGCLLAALAPTIGVLIVARILQGAGGAVFPLSFGIIRDEFPAARVPGAVGAMSGVIAAGSGLGVVLAGPVVDLLGSAWLFWIPLIAVALTAAAAYLFIPESPARTPGRMNWLAAFLLSGWLVAVLLPISKAPVWGWSSRPVIGLLILGAALLAAWAVTEVRSAAPLIDMRMMRLPGVWTTNLSALLFGAALFAVFALLPQFVQIPAKAGYGFGTSVSEAGLLVLPMLLAMFVAGLVSGRVEHRFSAKAQLAVGAAFSAVACAMLAVDHDTRWQIVVEAGILGLGVGLAYSSMTNLIVRNVAVDQTGAAAGMNANMRTIGGAIGAAVMSTIVTSHLQANGLPREAGFTHGFVVLAFVSVAAVAAALLVPRARPAEPRPEAAAPVRSTVGAAAD
ncbi:MAG TPA: MFS transporter [Kribbella sp.]|nr:MFS transporter [Kribbella sp.]